MAALVALNSSGNVFDRRTGALLGLGRGIAGEFAGIGAPSAKEVRAHWANPPVVAPLNTTLAVIATDAALAKHECTRLAGSGHDGMARAIDPIHTYVDGDVVFALATGRTAGARRGGVGCDPPVRHPAGAAQRDLRRRGGRGVPGDRARGARRDEHPDADQLSRPLPVGTSRRAGEGHLA